MAPKRSVEAFGAALSKFKRPKPAAPPEADATGTDEGDEEEGMPMEDPRNSSKDGETLFIDKSMFPGGCKVGDKYEIKGTVASLGSKIGIVPEEVEPYDEQAESAEDEVLNKGKGY